MLRLLTHRHLPKPNLKVALLAGLGALLGIAVLAGLTTASSVPLIMAPFGASCVLLFSVPASPLSQPANVLGGHFLSALIGLLVLALLGGGWLSMALAVGAAIAAMSLLRVTHPPAGANPIVIFALEPGFLFLITPVALGAALLVLVAILYHKAQGVTYPLQPPAS